MGTHTRGKLWFVIGLARSGKSTWCDLWATEEHSLMHPRVILSGDDFRHAIHGMTYLPEAEAYVFAAMDTAARALLRRGFDVIMDETCTTERTLLRYLSIDIEAQPIWIETSAEVCKARAIAGGKEYLLGPIGRMEKQVRLLKDGYDEIRKRLVEYVLMRRSQDNHV